MTPVSREKIIAKMMPTAATDVTVGSKIPSRQNVRMRRLRSSRAASPRASMICGTVARTNIPRVLTSALRK